MAILKRDQILSASDIEKELVPVPEWGGEIYVRGMTATERDKFEANLVEMKGKTTTLTGNNVRAQLAAWTIVDEEGLRLFSDKDIQALGRKSASALQRVFDVAQRLSGITDQDIEELSKNSESGQDGDSPSA